MKTCLTKYAQHLRSLQIGKSFVTCSQTLKVWRDYRKHHPVKCPLRRAFYNAAFGIPPSSRAAREQWHDRCKARLKNHEMKRAFKDPKFKRNWSRRLQRQARKLAAPIQSCAALTAWQGNRDQHTMINDQLRTLKAKTVPEPTIPRNATLMITGQEFRSGMLDRVRKQIGGKALDRCKWVLEPGFETRILCHVYHVSMNMKTKVRARHRIAVQHFMMLISEREFEIANHGLYTRQTAPEGYRFDWDQLGIKIVRDADGRDYHPANPLIPADEWVLNMQLLDQLRDSQEQRKLDQDKHRALFLADARNTRVTLQDSRRAGNCAQGSLMFAQQRLGLSDPASYNGLNAPGVRADVLLRTRDERAEAAARVAWERETIVQI